MDQIKTGPDQAKTVAAHSWSRQASNTRMARVMGRVFNRLNQGFPAWTLVAKVLR